MINLHFALFQCLNRSPPFSQEEIAKTGVYVCIWLYIYRGLHIFTYIYFTILYYTILFYTILYYTILFYTILYFTILYYTILYYTILHYTWISGNLHPIFHISEMHKNFELTVPEFFRISRVSQDVVMPQVESFVGGPGRPSHIWVSSVEPDPFFFPLQIKKK